MEQRNEKDGFQYAYSAREHRELEQIRARYTPGAKKEEDKLARVRRLDNAVTQKAQAVALIFGIIGALVLGLGMSLILSDLPLYLGVSGGFAVVLGILLGVVGIILVALAYPMYDLVTRRERAKIAPEILRLTEELMK